MTQKCFQLKGLTPIDNTGKIRQVLWIKRHGIEKILKLTISTDFDDNLKEPQFSNHSLKKENSKLTVRLKVPYNFHELDDFELKTLELLGSQKDWLTDISLDSTHCSHR